MVSSVPILLHFRLFTDIWNDITLEINIINVYLCSENDELYSLMNDHSP